MLLPEPAAEAACLIEVVWIPDVHAVFDAPALPGVEYALWEGEKVSRAMELVRALPDGELARCFTPRFGFRVHGPERLLFEIAFCFSCDRALLWGEGLPSRMRGQLFDGEDPAAQALLADFRADLPPEFAARLAPPRTETVPDKARRRRHRRTLRTEAVRKPS